MVRKSTASEHEQQNAVEPASNITGAAGQSWANTQTALFECVQGLTQRWLSRRQEALDETLRSIDQLRNTRDFSQIVRIQQEWLSHSLSRLMDDAAEFSNLGFDLSPRTASTMGRATQAVTHSAEQ